MGLLTVHAKTMFCTNCGNKLNEDNFCASCGTQIKNFNQTDTESLNSSQMTKEEYLNASGVESIDDARKKLKEIKLLFWGALIIMVAVEFVPEDGSLSTIALAVLVFYWVYLAFFIYYSAKLLSKLNLSKWSAVLVIFFAPFSWILFYPMMANPLKAMIGEIPVPPRLTAEQKAIRKAKEDQIWKWFKLLVGGAVLGIVLITIGTVLFLIMSS